MRDRLSYKIGLFIGGAFALLCKIALYAAVTYTFVDSVRHHHFPFAPITLLLVFWTWQRAVLMVKYLNTLHAFWGLPSQNNQEPTGIGPDGEWVYE